MISRNSWALKLGAVLVGLGLVLFLVYWMVPLPTLILNKIESQISAQLPSGWSLENWQVSRSYLRQLRKGELPQLNFELTDGQYRLFVRLEPRWNTSLSSPTIQAPFQIRLDSQSLRTSPLAGTVHMEFADQFQEITSFSLSWKDQDFALQPFGELQNFSGEVREILNNPSISAQASKVKSNVSDLEAALEDVKARVQLDLNQPFPHIPSAEISAARIRVDRKPGRGQLSELSIRWVSNSFDVHLGSLSLDWAADSTVWTVGSDTLALKGQLKSLEPIELKTLQLEIPAVSIKTGEDKEISLELISAQGHGAINNFEGQLKIGTGGAIWGETFLGFPENGLSVQLNRQMETIDLQVQGLLEKSSAALKCSSHCHLRWSLASNFERDVQTYALIFPDAPPLTLKPSGFWTFTGQLPLTPKYRPQWEKAVAALKFDQASLTNEAGTWALTGLSGNLPVKGLGETHGSLKINQFQYKNLKTSLDFPDWKFDFNWDKKQIRYWLPATQLGGDLSFVEIGAQELYWQSPNSLKFATNLFAASKNINPLLEKSCVAKASSVPTISWSARYPYIKASEKTLSTPEGSMSARVFTGTARLTQFKIDKWTKAIPETHFDFDIKNFNLEPLGKWLNFGRMEGLFEFFAHDVLFRAKIPTGFRSRVELLPTDDEHEIIFSSKAMKNFVQLFTSQDVTQQIPGIVRWFSFGWPSDLIGGFNIQYAGISMFSNDGSILLETLDPKWVLQKERQHYILYGKRFKIPINAMSYPVVLDAPAMSQFVSHMYYQLVDLQGNETPNDGESDETENWCNYNLDGSTP